MKEVDRLAAAVAKLGARPAPRSRDGRVLTADDPWGLIEAVLDEIDETVLARELRVRNGRDEEIRLEVSGRRLLRVAGVMPKELADSCEAVPGTAIVEADGAASRALAEVLRAMATGSPAFAVVSRKLSRRPDPGETGCSPEALRASWKQLEAQPARGHRLTLTEFVARTSRYARAFVRLEGGSVVQQEGEHHLLQQLAELSRIEPPAGRMLPPGQETGSCVILDAATGDGDAILHASDGRHALLLVLPAELTMMVIEHWQGTA